MKDPKLAREQLAQHRLKNLGGYKESIQLPKCTTLAEVYKAVFDADIKVEFLEPLNPDGDEPEDPPEQGPYPLDDPGDDEKRSAHGK